MANKRSSTAEVRRGKRPANSQGHRGGGAKKKRPSDREVVIVQKKSSPAVLAALIGVMLVGVILSTLLIIDLLGRKDQTAGTAGTQAGNQQQQGPTIPQLEAALKAQPSNTGIRLQLAYAYYAAQQLDKAEEQVNIVLKSDPKNYQALDYSGLIAAGRGKLDEAVKLFDQALATNPPDKVDALWDKGNVLLQARRFAEAIPVFEEFAALPRIKGSQDEQTARRIISQAQAELAKQK